MMSHFEESIIIGMRAISGSEAMRFRNSTMAALPSIMASSIFTSSICAPPSTWSRATEIASSKLPSRMSLRNFKDPVTLVRSPILMKLEVLEIIKGSRPERADILSFWIQKY